MGIKYRYDGDRTELQNADDFALVAKTLQQLQEMLNTHTKAYEALSLKLNIGKTKHVHSPENLNNPIKMGEELMEYVAGFN